MLRLAAQRAACAAWNSACSASGSQLEAVARQLLPAAASRMAWQRPYSSGSEEEQREVTDPKVLELAEQILDLNLLQVADLTTVLKQKLGVSSTMPMGMMGMPMGMPAAAAAPAAEAAPAAPVEEKTEFTLKLDGFDAASKIKVIKEIRAITGLGLKEAKDLVEGAPKVVKEGLKKEEAEALQKTLVEAGAKVSLD